MLAPWYLRSPALDALKATDPHWSSVVLLAINDSKADTTTTFADQSGSAHTITANGNSQYDTDQAPTGLTSSGLFDGTGDWLSAADHANWDFGTGDFTIELTVRYNSSEPAGPKGVISSGAPGSVASFWTLEGYAGQKLAFFNSAASGSPLLLSTTTSWSNTWRYVAVRRSGDDYALYVDSATPEATATNVAVCNSDGGLYIGAGWYAPASRGISAWIGSVRITKGVARTIGASPTLPYPNS